MHLLTLDTQSEPKIRGKWLLTTPSMAPAQAGSHSMKTQQRNVHCGVHKEQPRHQHEGYEHAKNDATAAIESQERMPGILPQDQGILVSERKVARAYPILTHPHSLVSFSFPFPFPFPSSFLDFNFNLNERKNQNQSTNKINMQRSSPTPSSSARVS